MNTEPFGPELTAFALNDPGLSEDQKHAIERRIAADPAAKQMVEETYFLSRHLSDAMSVNVEPIGDSPMGHTVAASMLKQPGKPLLQWWVMAVAACVVLCIGAMVRQQNAEFYAQLKPAAPIEKVVPVDESKSTGDRVLLGKGFTQPASTDVQVIPLDSLGGIIVRGKTKEEADAIKGIVNQLQPGSVPPSPPPPFRSSPYTVATGGKGGFGGGGLGGGQFNGGFGGGGFQGGGYPANPQGRVQDLTQSKIGQTQGQLALLNVPHNQNHNQNSPEVQIPLLEAQRKQYHELGLGADHEKVKSLNGQIRFWQELAKQQTNDYQPQGRDAYSQLIENPFTEVKGEAALSTFGVDVDTASYSIVRNYLNKNQLPPANAVRLEEMVNYFPYKDAPPEGNDPFTVRVEMAECPWQPKHRLARIALKAKPIDNSKRPKSNLVFLIDVSGSMDAPNRLPLVKASMKLLVEQLGENDRVALVVYAGASGLVLDSTNCGNKTTILKALDDLTPGGSTNGASGIQLAYDIAVKNFVEKGTNRVILCTDGDWNVGTTSTDALIKLIEEKRKTGVFLSVFGFGMGNLRDEMMVQLAGKGNGNYGYIDTIAEAKKALVEQVSGTLVTVAKDVKIQIEFNPARVASYRLLGYEKRILAAKDFHDDKKDAGEMGAGHVVTALYEIIPNGAAAAEPKIDGLRYQPKVEAPKPAVDDKIAKEAFVLKLRHKMPDKDESVLREIPVGDVAKSFDKPSDDLQFATAVAAFTLILKDSPYKGSANYALVEELAAASMTNDPGAYRAEFLQLVKKAKALSGGK